jgi:hypothetical protein
MKSQADMEGDVTIGGEQIDGRTSEQRMNDF